MASGEPYEDIYYTSRDGLRLHARRYAPSGGSGRHSRPVICLPGLTRNGRDFHDLAMALSKRSHTPRTIYTLDYRGRGLSDFDPDWRNYALPIEMLDVIDFITLTGLQDAALIGTSRGGLISMLLAAAQPTAVGAVVLNDIGPVIEHEGMARISGYVGRVPLPISWPDAARMMRELNRRHFPEISEAVWEDVARQWYNEKNGKPAPGYDSNLGNALSVLDGPMPTLWPQFEALKRVPLMVVRGENSDILTAQTVDEMRRRHPAMASVTVPNQGHAPLLKDPTTTEAIRHFLTAADAGRQFAALASA
jgi:pimeloyl-ACP methyl ester carboxylesterase